jgi:GNAT superfamily N-acetyltransferase
VGRRYHWVDRLGWGDAEARARLASPEVFLHLMSVAGAPAGYFELERRDDGSVEIAYFGLLPEYLGRGLGKYLLSQAASAAWALSPSRVWLHTCTLDAAAALPNYLARGFRPYKTETYETEPADGERG